jgi:hypothetical protein
MSNETVCEKGKGRRIYCGYESRLSEHVLAMDHERISTKRKIDVYLIVPDAHSMS